MSKNITQLFFRRGTGMIAYPSLSNHGRQKRGRGSVIPTLVNWGHVPLPLKHGSRSIVGAFSIPNHCGPDEMFNS